MTNQPSAATNKHNSAMTSKTALRNTALRLLPLSILLIILDQGSKFIMSALLSYQQRIIVLPSFNLHLVHNKGAAFSFLANQTGWQQYFLSSISLIVSIGIIWWMAKVKLTEQRLLSYSLVILLGGAIGNLIDRALFGFVVDFIELYWQQWYWPVFNIADICISLAVGLMLLDSFKNRKPTDKPTKKTNSTITNPPPQ